MKGLIAMLMGAAVLTSSVFWTTARAEEPAATKDAAVAKDAPAAKVSGEKAAAHKEKPALVEMTVTGKVTKEEKAGKDGKTRTHYILTDAAGDMVMLDSGRHEGKHEGKEAASAAPAVNLADYVDKDVTIVGKGFQKEKDGKKVTHMEEITKIEAAAAAPAAK